MVMLPADDLAGVRQRIVREKFEKHEALKARLSGMAQTAMSTLGNLGTRFMDFMDKVTGLTPEDIARMNAEDAPNPNMGFRWEKHIKGR